MGRKDKGLGDLKGGTLNSTSPKDKVWGVIQGMFLEKGFTLKNVSWVIALVLLFLAQGVNSYTFLRSKKEIDYLTRENAELRMEKITVETTLMGARRLSSIENRVQEESLDLSIPKNPPIVIDR